MKLEYDFDVIIIGMGPAGMTAAMYLKRANINTLIIDKSAPGGTLNKITSLDNYPGYVDKEGTTLAFRMYSQLEDLNVDLKIDEVIKLYNEEDCCVVQTKKDMYKCKYVIIATGKSPRTLDVKESNKFEGKGISYCVLCDGALYKNKNVAIVGGGNSAMQAALYLKDIAKKIYLINRSSKLRADEYEQNKVKNEKTIDILLDKKISKIIEDNGKISKIELNDNSIIEIDGIFVCIGQEINSKFYDELKLEQTLNGINVDLNMQTSIKNIYACGDIIDKKLYQVVTATNDGAVAANSIIGKLKS